MSQGDCSFWTIMDSFEFTAKDRIERKNGVWGRWGGTACDTQIGCMTFLIWSSVIICAAIMKVYVMIFFLLWGCFSVPARPVVPEALRLEEGVEWYAVGEHLSFLEDADRLMEIDAVAARFPDGFCVHERSDIAFGYSDSRYWLRLDIDASSSERGREWVLEFPGFSSGFIDLYRPGPDGGFQHFRAGNYVERDAVRMHGNDYAIPLCLQPEEINTVYIALQSAAPISSSVNLMSMAAFAEKEGLKKFGYGIYYGIILVMGLYNLMLFFGVRDRIYLDYVVYILALLLLQLALNGDGNQFVWKNSLFMRNSGLLFCMGLFGAILGWFSARFLQLKELYPKLCGIMRGLVCIGIVFMLLSFSGRPAAFIPFCALYLMVTPSVILAVSIICVCKGSRSARYFLVAWAFYLVCGNIYGLQIFGIIPSNVFTEHVLYFGSTIEVVLIAFALADKINVEKNDKIRAQRLAREAQEKTVDELARLAKLKDRLLANTSHELRTPLNGIIGMGDALLSGRKGRLSASAAADIALIVSSGRRLSNLICDILDVGQIRADKIRLNCGPVHLKRLVDSILQSMADLVEEKNLELKNTVSGELPLVHADVNRLEQIFYNLVGNAVKFTERGGVTVSAKKVRSDTGDLLIEICVEDTGPGIEPEYLSNFFNPFEQTENRRLNDGGGTGLGLAVTRDLVELHGGTIRVESTEGAGARLFFTLKESRDQDESNALPEKRVLHQPVELAADALEEPGRLLLPGGSPLAESGEFTIMAVDDDHINLKVILSNLDFANVRLIALSSGERALEHIREQGAPDLLLLDVMMPGRSGHDTCREIRKHYSFLDLPVIMITANSLLSCMNEAFEVGANDYVLKPVDRTELLLKITNQLQLVQKRKTLLDPAGASLTPEQKRLQIVRLMQACLAIWEKHTGTARAELADRSGIWTVYTDRDGGRRTQTLDKYLDPVLLPGRPRIKSVLETVRYIESACTLDPKEKEELATLRLSLM
jgi:signal transduction histidine kinase/CheY-like chemotaxis protein